MKRREIFRFIGMMLFALLTAAQFSPGLAQTCLVRLQPNPIEVKVGETAQLVVDIVDVQELYGVDLLIKFDPDVLEVVDAYTGQEGTQVDFGTFLDSGLEIRNIVDNTTGTVRFAMTQLNPSLPKSGSGQLVVITFKGKKVSSSSPITFEKVQLARRDGIEIQADIENGNANVVWNVSEATNTSVPTQMAGTPMSALIQTVTAMPSKTPTQVATNTATKTQKVKNTPTPTPANTQVSHASGSANLEITYTQPVSSLVTELPVLLESTQAATSVPASATEGQSNQKTETPASLPLETIMMDNIKSHSPSKPTEDEGGYFGFPLLFAGIGIGITVSAVGFGVVYFLRKR